MQIEIGQYKLIDKGTLKASFSVLIDGQKILDCKYFVNGDRRWFNFPQKEVKREGQDKPDYIPLISYVDKTQGEAIKAQILEALKTAQPSGAHEKSQAYTNRESALPNQPPVSSASPPF